MQQTKENVTQVGRSFDQLSKHVDSTVQSLDEASKHIDEEEKSQATNSTSKNNQTPAPTSGKLQMDFVMIIPRFKRYVL